MQEKVKNSEYAEEIKGKAIAGARRLVRIRSLTVSILWGCGAWLLGQAPLLFGTYPLGLALLCASAHHTLPILIGSVLSAFWQSKEPAVYIVSYLAAALVRALSALILDVPEVNEWGDGLRRKLRKGMEAVAEESDAGETHLRRLKRCLRVEEGADQAGIVRETFQKLFSESVRLRMASCAVCGFITALYRIIGGGFRYYDLFAAIFMLLVAPAAVLVWSVCLGSKIETQWIRRVSQMSLLFAFIWSADGVFVSGLPLCAILAFFFTLAATHTEGYLSGVVIALICGLAYDPMHVPALLLAALVYAAFRGMKRENIGVFIAVLAALVWCSYAQGLSTLILLLPSLLISGSVFRLYTILFSTVPMSATDVDDNGDRHRVEGERYRDSNERFRGISDAFSSLSEMFYNLSDRFRRPGTLDLRRICDSSFDSVCPDCPNKSICWGLEYANTLHTVSGLVSALHTKGRVTRAQIPAAMMRRCESADRILEQINGECAKLTGELLRNNRTEIFAMDYESAAEIINDALEEDDGEYRFDHALEQRILEYLTDAGVGAQSVTVYGKRRRQILLRGVDVEHATVSVETMRADLGEMCGLELACPIFEIEDNVSLMTFRAKQRISVISAESNLSADGGVSGDSVNLFSNKKDYFYALICDGMGAGQEAAFTSGLCTTFLEKMLRAGNRAGTSLQMLNNMIRSRSADSTRECSSTVDLLELDLMTAEAVFIKSGASPSFVVRDRVVQRLQAGTAPIGIIRAVDVQSTPFQLRVGDTVVLISDGILQDDPECEWISRFLTDAAGLTPEEIVYHICLHASKNEEHDDCSALAIRVCAAKE
ncbi:MAG: hypothetical protein E7666_05790 [Ruminococcaceae bacterium]|nr:hypothetical protein [Oscillospiraceae bacterium]